MIYTRTGDKLETSAIGGQRISKSSPIISFYGEIDSLNAMMGYAASIIRHKPTKERIEREQGNLFMVPMLVTKSGNTPNQHSALYAQTLNSATATLEQEIDQATPQLAPLASFVLPGGSVEASVVGLARTQCRQAERALSALSPEWDINSDCAAYINRLSDWLFIEMRVLNKISNTEEKTIFNLL